MARLAVLTTLLLTLVSLALALPADTDTDSTEKITCFHASQHHGPSLTTAQANTLVSEFNRAICQSSATTPISLAPFEGVEVTIGSTFIVFRNELGVEATPPSCGEVVGDFMELVERCFTGSAGPGGLLVETAGGGRTAYVISAR